MSPSNTQVPHQEDRIQFGKIVAVGIGALVCFALGIVWADGIRSSIYEESTVPSEVGQAEVGIVDQHLFTLDHRAQDLKNAKRAHLNSYGWVNEDRTIGHIPIEQAMKLVLAGKGGAQAPAPQPAHDHGSEEQPR